MARLQLFGSRISPFVEKTARLLEWKGLDFQMVDIKSPMDLKRWNPQTGKMPVLDIDGQRVYDSTFIARRVQELHPEPPLWAADDVSAALQRTLEDWADESLYWHLMALRWCGRNASATTEQICGSAPALLRPLLRVLLPRQVGRVPRVQGFGRLPYDILIRELGLRLDDLLCVLDDRPFFHADQPSLADLSVYGQLHMARSGPTPDAAGLITARSGLVDYLKRVEEATAR